MHKKLLQIIVGELHQEMLQFEENWGLTDAKYEDGNEIIIDTVLIYLIPIQGIQINERHKVICDHEKNIYANSLHA